MGAHQGEAHRWEAAGEWSLVEVWWSPVTSWLGPRARWIHHPGRRRRQLVPGTSLRRTFWYASPMATGGRGWVRRGVSDPRQSLGSAPGLPGTSEQGGSHTDRHSEQGGNGRLDSRPTLRKQTGSLKCPSQREHQDGGHRHRQAPSRHRQGSPRILLADREPCSHDQGRQVKRGRGPYEGEHQPQPGEEESADHSAAYQRTHAGYNPTGRWGLGRLSEMRLFVVVTGFPLVR